jgi:hypothetical protein
VVQTLNFKLENLISKEAKDKHIENKKYFDKLKRRKEFRLCDAGLA